jgi:nitroimidazol reductase NimA-like FMN-containing flavoprotein (pyridoxamine 5'-phosphate oxidase superfamily)
MDNAGGKSSSCNDLRTSCMNESAPSDRTTVKRKPQRAAYDRVTIHAILDEGFVCHVALLVEGQPCAIPTLYVRLGDHLYLHGSPASRMLQALQEGATVSIAVTLIDGLVLARSAVHHSMNYRSVVVFGIPAAATILRGRPKSCVRFQTMSFRVAGRMSAGRANRNSDRRSFCRSRLTRPRRRSGKGRRSTTRRTTNSPCGQAWFL